MRRMDRARRIGGLVWVLGGALFQVVLALARGVVPGAVTLATAVIVLGLAGCTLAGAGTRVLRAATTVTGVTLGLNLLGAVADRFGAFGPPGGPGVSWGSWPAFVDYTGLLLPGLPPAFVLLAAVGASAAETVLGVGLIAGVARRWVGKATAGLLVVYVVAMAWSLGLSSLAVYAVPVLVGGALLVSAGPERRPAPRRRAVPDVTALAPSASVE
jgi:hypothetical protein